VVLDWWRQRLPGSTPPVLDNGSGLSRSERVSAQALSDLLGRMARSPVADDLLASLPVAGMDATMRNRARAVAGQAWLKTGSLRDVSAIAGYAQSASGRRYAVVGIINHDNAGPARAALDALVQWVVQQDLP
jgi:D-alanyl-D-alanine carboxypeptidase/D-alanyl-D-alanine-endopeptidase (penicillin-binding protein 4)